MTLRHPLPPGAINWAHQEIAIRLAEEQSVRSGAMRWQAIKEWRRERRLKGGFNRAFASKLIDFVRAGTSPDPFQPARKDHENAAHP